MSRKIVMTLVCILVLGLSGCGDTLTLNQYNTSEIWYIAYTDIDTVCESNELTADGSSILHSEEDYLLLSYVVDSNIEITKELKDGGWDHLILTNPQWIDRFGDPSKLKPVEYGSLANSMQEFLDVQMPILTADGNVLPDGVGLYQYDGETLLAFPVHAAMFRVGTSFIFSRIKSRSASVTLNLICTVLLRPSMLSLLSIPRVWDTSQ